MWPRGFPLEYFHVRQTPDTVILQNNKVRQQQLRTCRLMPTPSVQQGLVRKVCSIVTSQGQEPDVDAIYRLLNADSEFGLNEVFHKHTPPVTLGPGVFSPWNSQNTLFRRSAFHILMLPVSVGFRVTDIWRSFYAQAVRLLCLYLQQILHLSDDNVGFYPPNAVHVRNAHSYLRDFEDERYFINNSVSVSSTWMQAGSRVSYQIGNAMSHQSVDACLNLRAFS